MERVQVIDSHTGGEPTRVVIGGGPDLGTADYATRRRRFQAEHDAFRSAVVNEPRGSDVMVGALLGPPVDPACVAGVVFFNNVGVLGMCGHGAIGVGVTLGRLGRIGAGRHKLETPVGIVEFEYDARHEVTLDNVPSRRHARGVRVDVPGHGPVTGDVAWGGNWFFLVSDHGRTLEHRRAAELTEFSLRIRSALEREGVTGEDGQPIDHVELFGPPADPANDSRNFVLCPGGAYDRSPCGTGTSAKLACLHADGKLPEGREWRQESIVGSLFVGSVRIVDGAIVPRIRGSAYVCGETTLLFDPLDPFRHGIRS